MQKNWYIIYTKPKQEKKTSKALVKRKIENYVPMNSKTISQSRKTKIQKEPLFQNYLFAKISKDEMPAITSLDSVINFVYWKQQPVTIAQEDILVIKNFATKYADIQVNKTDVNINILSYVIDGSQRSLLGNVLTIENTFAEVILPAIGFSISAKIKKENSLHTEATSLAKILHLQ